MQKIKLTTTPKKDRKQRLQHERRTELEKIDLYTKDISDVEIDTKILKKLSRKIGRNRR